ncbi:MAG: hypothetical protein QGH20_02895 [Candidatus Latescibacteria bacterium]|jgi:hypothetical protein|nr:hypothetical protein [Candidatus Latescibacterota bacterium]
MRSLLLVVGAVAVAIGCGGDPFSSEQEAIDAMEEGWRAYLAGDYAAAGIQFRTAQGSQTHRAEASIGVGWTFLRQDVLSLARAAFKEAERHRAHRADAEVGLAFLAWASGDFTEVIVLSEAVSSDNPDYRFEEDPRIDVRDVRLLTAQAHLLLDPTDFGHLRAVSREVVALDYGASVDPDEPSTWTDGKVAYNTAAEALVRRLEAIYLTLLIQSAEPRARVATDGVTVPTL